ncbi:MAG TPA: hypothetical protein VFF29_04235, partial [Bacteroidota bacterium]|nr:hypothetical protein [Bacteroidota bacterium]
MVFLALFLCIFIGSYIALQYLKERGADQRSQKLIVVFAGLSAWSFVIVVISVVIKIVTGDLFFILFMLVLTGLALRLIYPLTQVYDTWQIRNFFLQALQFRGYDIWRKDLNIELEKQKIRQIHRETSDKPLADFESKKKPIPHVNPEEVKRELEKIRARPIQSIHLDNELTQLRDGKIVNISESWKLNSFKYSSHRFYDQIKDVHIDPLAKSISLSLDCPDITESKLQDKVFLFRFHQDLYDLLQAIQTEQWMKPYLVFVRQMELTCYTIEADSFVETQLYPFMMITIQFAELKKWEG